MPVMVGAALAVGGALTKIAGSILGGEASAEAIAAQQHAEAIKQAQARADAERRKRQMIRQGNILRAQAVSNSVASGSNESSALPGAMGQISGETSFNVSGVNTALNFGKQLYQANQELLSARQDMAFADTVTGIGSGLSTLGGAFVNNMAGINAISSKLTGAGQQGQLQNTTNASFIY